MNSNTKLVFGYVIVVFLGVGMVVGGSIWREQRNQHRIETMPHIPGTILSFERTKAGVRAWIEFTRMSNGSPVNCRTQVHIETRNIAVGQTIAVVPRDDSCGEPAVAVSR